MQQRELMLVVLPFRGFPAKKQIAKSLKEGGCAGGQVGKNIAFRTLVGQLLIAVNGFSEHHNNGIDQAVKKTAEHAESKRQNL